MAEIVEEGLYEIMIQQCAHLAQALGRVRDDGEDTDSAKAIENHQIVAEACGGMLGLIYLFAPDAVLMMESQAKLVRRMMEEVGWTDDE